MSFALDHVVIAVADLERAIAHYTELGFTVFHGGEHPRGSVNALIVFADGAYFELIAFPKPAADFRWWQLLTAAGPGYVDFALTPGIPNDMEAARARGFLLHGPEQGGRLTPSGQNIRWQSFRPPTTDVPFVCADITPRPLRVPEGEVRWHRNGALGIMTVSVRVADVAASAAKYQLLLESSDNPSNDGNGARRTFQCGSTEILLHPLSKEDEVKKRGEGVSAVTLKGNGPPKSFDLTLTHGAFIDMRQPEP